MRYSSEVYQKIVEQMINKQGVQVFEAIQSDIKTLTINIEKFYSQKTLTSFTFELKEIIQEDYKSIQNQGILDRAFKFIDFQHHYIAFQNLEMKFPSQELEVALNEIRHLLDDICAKMAQKLENFSL